MDDQTKILVVVAGAAAGALVAGEFWPLGLAGGAVIGLGAALFAPAGVAPGSMSANMRSRISAPAPPGAT